MISPYLNGRLGNQMFQYAIARATAERIGCNFFIPGTPDEAVRFYTDMSKQFGVYLQMPYPENPHFWSGHGLFNVSLGTYDGVINRMGNDAEPQGRGEGDGIFLNGYFQSESHFSDLRGDVKQWFSISEDVIKRTAPILAVQPPDETCYIHFRGGDYKSIQKWYLPRQYYHDAMGLVRSKMPGIRFLVVTDDKEEAASVLPGFEMISNDSHVDFSLLNQARWCIIPNSTFSWWACWLNDENFVVAPYGWLNHNSGTDFDPKGIQTQRFNYIKRR